MRWPVWLVPFVVLVLGLSAFPSLVHDVPRVQGTVPTVGAWSEPVRSLSPLNALALGGAPGAWTTTITSLPGGRGNSVVVYDSAADQFVLFGGVGVTDYLNDTWSYDLATNTWANLSPVVSPYPRGAFGMVYDSAADRLVLFGGRSLPGANFNDTWSYDLATNTWTDLNPSTAPSARWDFDMVYDSGADRVVLFGGYGTTTNYLSDTWSYDLGANTWTSMNPVVAPPELSAFSMAYDSAADRTVLFGGYELDVPGGVNDTWSYDFASNTWTNRTAAIAPGDRIDSYMAYDSAANRIVLFGGETSTGFLNDTWSYDFGTNTWTNVSTAIAPDQWLQPGMAYDSAADRSVVFADVWQPAYLIDVWSYDLTTDIWTNIGPGTKPLARAWHAMVYDSRADQTVVFGGACLGNVTGVLSNETLVYDFNTSVWMNMSPVKAPSARANLSMAYDSAADRIVLFGGLTAAWDILNDTWSYDLATNTWTNVSPTISPAARAWGAMVYDSAADRIVLFGGRTATGDVLNDTWSYDLATNTWTDLSPVVAPYQRSDFDMAYDSRADRVVLFGGRTPTEFFNDTWSYDLATNTWTDLNPVVAPSARIEPNMAYDAAADRIVLFGGMGTMSVLNDTWSYDLATNTWTNLSPSVSPLARFGFGMVYDSAADRTIIFGGFSFSVSSSFSGSLDDTWWYRFPEIPSAPQTLQASLGGALPAILAVVVVAAVVVALWVLVSRKRRTPPEEPAKSEEPPK